MSYGWLEAKRCVLEYRSGRRVLSSGVGGTPIMDVACSNNVLIVAVNGHGNRVANLPHETMMMVINSPEPECDSDVQRGTLMHFIVV